MLGSTGKDTSNAENGGVVFLQGLEKLGSMVSSTKARPPEMQHHDRQRATRRHTGCDATPTLMAGEQERQQQSASSVAAEEKVFLAPVAGERLWVMDFPGVSCRRRALFRGCVKRAFRSTNEFFSSYY
jgi:hypothetical protein